MSIDLLPFILELKTIKTLMQLIHRNLLIGIHDALRETFLRKTNTPTKS